MTVTAIRPTVAAPTPDHCALPWCVESTPGHINHMGTDESAEFVHAGSGYGPADDGYLRSLMACLERRDPSLLCKGGPVLINLLVAGDRADGGPYLGGHMRPDAVEDFAQSLLVLVALARGAEVDASLVAASRALDSFRAFAATAVAEAVAA